MMYVWVGDRDDMIKNIDYVHRNIINAETYKNSIVVEAMQDIEHVYKIDGLSFYSSDFGIKGIDSISGGMQLVACLATNKDIDRWYRNALAGSNVSKYIQKLSKVCTFNICWQYWMELDDDYDLDATFVQTGKIAHTTREFYDCIYDIGGI